MNNRTVGILAFGICLLLLTLASPSAGDEAVASSAFEGLMDTGVNASTSAAKPSESAFQPQASSSWACLPQYSEPEEMLTLYPPSDLHHMVSADFNDDGWPDVILARAFWQSTETFELDVLLNDGGGNLVLGTSEVFSGTVPSVRDARELVLADFNGDDRPDMFFADQGMDAPPNPGYQNTLVLSAPGGKLVDATDNLPQQNDMSHSAATADIDGDQDIDLYIGNTWGQNMIPPQIWLNVGSTGVFTLATGRLPFPLKVASAGNVWPGNQPLAKEALVLSIVNVLRCHVLHQKPI